MAMAYVLEYATEYLRERYGWKPENCGVQNDNLPPYMAGAFYIALDDGGVETGTDATASLREIFNITVGIWRRPEHLAQKDRRHNLQLPLDKYLLGAYTLHDLERSLVAYNAPQSLFGLHQNWAFMQGLNTRYNLPSVETGDKFATCLTYRGRGKLERIGIEVPGTEDAQPWYGYRLLFRGLLREQVTNNSNYPLG